MDDLDQDVKDFIILKEQLFSRSVSVASSASNSTSSTQSGEPRRKSIDAPPPVSPQTDSEIWPLYLHPYFLENYIFGEIIGQGSYAQVRECIDSVSLDRFAVKIVNLKYLSRNSKKIYDNQMQEIKFLKQMKHKNVLSLKECLFRNSRVYIIMEFCTINLSTLRKAQPNQRLEPLITLDLFKQLICGLSYIHSIGIVHRDIKPQNLLINNLGVLKIIDFGVSHILNLWQRDSTCFNYEGSPLFQAPEVVSGEEKYDGFKVDVWSSGVTLHVLIFGVYPFQDEALLGLYDKILADNLTKPPELPSYSYQRDALLDLLNRMLEKVADRRIDINSIAKHPWLSMDSEITSNDLINLSKLILLKTSNYKMDCYRSMSVLSYLYTHHFPEQRIFKFKPNSFTPLSSTPTNSSSSTIVSLEASSASTPTNSPSPHEIVEDTNIEWGTEQQYNLLKIPRIRVNRIRNLVEKRRKRKTKNQKQ